MAKKKKKSPPARGYATTSIERKPDPVPVEAVEEPVEEPNAKTSQPPDAWENGVISALQAEDPHRLLKSQVESEFRTSQIKLEKLLSLDSIPSIAISEKIEKKLYAFISGYAQDIQSKHRTINDNQLVLEKSLHHTFLMLEKMGFQRSLIKEALSQISSKTLEGALEWICLNAPTEALPNGFYDKIIYEQDAIVQVTPAASKVTLSENASKENIEPKRVFDEKIPDLKYLSIKVSASAESIQAEKVLDMDALARDADLKARILASAERMKEQEDKAKEAKLAIRTKAYDEYIHLSLNLHRARAKSSPDAPKEIRSKMGRYIHESSQRIKMVLVPVMHAWLEKADKRVQELWEDEKDFELDPEIPEPAQLQAVEKPLQIQAATKENVVVESDSSKIESQQDAKEDHESKAEDEDDGVPLMGSMFEENQESQPPIGSTTTSTGTIMDLTYPGWAPRMSPKDLFDEWVGKNVPGGRITISPLKQTSIGYRAELKLSSQKADAKIFCMEESEQATTKMDAKHYVSIKALFELAPKYQVQNRLPPPYRDLWRDWTEKVEAENNQAIHILNVDRIEFINELLKSLPGSRRPSVSSKTNDETIAPQSPDTVGRDTQAKNSLSDAYWNVMQQRKPSPGYQSLLAVRRTLPVFNAREEILEQVKSHQVVVIAGETGSGKSTQVPQFLLEDAIEHKQAGSVNILCTQPRRISATSLATRVSQEMGDRKGQVGKPESFVGYQVRMENCTSKTTRLTYCTTGILLRRMVGDPLLKSVTHIVIDEVHERSLDSDFLLLLIKRVLPKRPDLRVVLMSATADLNQFKAYFATKGQEPTSVSVPGRTFPVEEFYLDELMEITDWVPPVKESYRKNEGPAKNFQKVAMSGKGGTTYNMVVEWDADDFTEETSQRYVIPREIDMDLLEHVISWIVRNKESDGSLLVFLPGVNEIKTMQGRLEALCQGVKPLPCVVYPLYSELQGSDQQRVFEPAPQGLTKVVLSTNIAETGLTIPDVVYVVDSARAREVSYDPTRHLTCLKDVIVSQANCKQRKGRAGRVQSGYYFSLLPLEAYKALPEYRPAEILRLPLEDVCLKARATLGPTSVSGNLVDLFASALDPPPLKNIDKALSILKQVRALNSNEDLTPLGKHLANLGIDVRLGKMILFAVALRCLDPILTIAAALSLGKSPFFRPSDMIEYRRTMAKFKTEDSDLMMIYNAYQWWQDFFDKGESLYRIYSYCNNNYISFMNLKNIQMAKNQILKTLFDSGLLPRSDSSSSLSVPAHYNERATSTPLVLCTLSACLFPNIIYKAPTKMNDIRPSLFVLGKTVFVNVHNSSLLKNELPAGAAWFSSHVIKGVKGGSNSAMAMDLNRLSAFGMISLVADDVHVNYLNRCLNLDGKSITIKAFPKSATLMTLFSRLLHKAISSRLGITRNHELKQDESEGIIDIFVSALEV